MSGLAHTDLADLQHAGTYVRFDSGVENVPDTEAEDIRLLWESFSRIIPIDHKEHGHTYPTTHAKTLGIVKGKLIVSNDLPAHLKQGIFAKGGEYPVAMRHSVNSHNVAASPAASISRGLTLKIFNVPGDRFPEGEGNETWDILFNSQIQISELSNARVAREMTEILEKGLTDPASVGPAIMKRPDVKVQIAASMQPKIRPEGMAYYSQFAYRFGDYVAKIGVVPATPAQAQIAAEGELPKDKNTASGVAQLMKEFYTSNQAAYDLKFQLLENPEEQPVEYAGTKWDDSKYPYQTVGQLVFPKQDSDIDELRTFWEDNMWIYAWRGPKIMQPLGGSNRARRVVYNKSRELRWKLNPSSLVDVQKIEDLPGPVPS